MRRSRDRGGYGAAGWRAVRELRQSTVIEHRLIAPAPPVRKFGLRVAVQGRYFIALLQRSIPPVHVGLRLSAVRGARRRWKDRTRRRPAGRRRQACPARNPTGPTPSPPP